MPAVGLTDHGTFAGAIQMLKTCRHAGIKPILGMEGYLARDHKCHDKKGQPDGRKGNRHLNIIAKNFQGYQNLCALSQISSLEGMYYDPRVDLDLLEKYKEGLIITSACPGNVINRHLFMGNYDKAKKAASLFKDIFLDDFYLEMMFHGLDIESKILPDIQRLGKELDITVIVTNDVHYIKKEDAEYHEIILCVSSGRCLKDPKRIKFPYSEFYFKSQEEMYSIFKHVPKYLINTMEIAEKCDYSDLVFVEDNGPMRLPKFDIPEGFSSPHDYLEHLARQGLKKLKLDRCPDHIQRLKTELDDIRLTWDTKRYDFATYFLIVDDIMRFARSKGISAGIRGSGFGSLILQCLGITEGIDVIDFGLLWERFLGFESSHQITSDDFGI